VTTLLFTPVFLICHDLQKPQDATICKSESDSDDVETLLIDEADKTPQPIAAQKPDANNEMIIQDGEDCPEATDQVSADDDDPDPDAAEISSGAPDEQSDKQAPTETGPGCSKKKSTVAHDTIKQPVKKIKSTHEKVKEQQLAAPWRFKWEDPEQFVSFENEGDEPNTDKMSLLNTSAKDVELFFGGRLDDELFVYNHAYTLGAYYFDHNDFIRHKLNLDTVINQGTRKYGKPASQACIRLTNYVFWQDEAQYTPMKIDEIAIPELDNLVIARDVKVKTLMPLIFVEQAWFKLNFDTFTDALKNHPSFLKVGYFPYIVGRGVTLGYHDDLAVEYLGWAGDGGFTRFPFMPPGVLFRTNLTDHCTWDVYFNLWRETNASLSDNLMPTRDSRLYSSRPHRGSGKDRTTWVTKLDYSRDFENFGNMLAQPYFVYVNAPEQNVELIADASSKLFTAGIMVDWHKNNFSFNLEVAGQGGYQHMHAIDRNIEQLNRSSSTGNLSVAFSHILQSANATPVSKNNPANRSQVPAGSNNLTVSGATNPFEPNKEFAYVVNNTSNRTIAQQNAIIKLPDGNPAQIQSGIELINSDVFANKRFRPAYKLSNQGFMALADFAYEFERHPYKIAAAAGHISGDAYPYNEEVDKTYSGFIPLRSRYKGLAVQNFLIFDRLVIPRPLNISYRTLYAFNDVKDLSNLEFVGLGFTWFPWNEKRKQCAVTTDLMFLWEATTLKKWDKNGKHPDAGIETQLERLRNTFNGSPTLFSGWESDQNARHMLGTELDLKIYYKLLEHCDFTTRVTLFFPGGLYKDLDGQPNNITRRVDEQGYMRYDSLGHTFAFAFVAGLDYRF
jgi:hypothetical protein